MLEITSGDLLAADVEALVNPVNCVGVMGKGLALQFKRAFPENYRRYRLACGRGTVRAGDMFVVSPELPAGPRWIINFPTKRHFRDPSRMEDIEAGLIALVRLARELNIKSIAVPALGAGLGGLAWEDVRPCLETAFAGLPEVRVLLFEPRG
jgi:O-acetyl-ADP-ribose deacetylase (regulator of RNase III)